MKTFEEKWTAWVDDQLTGAELAKFEASLPDRAAAEAEKRATKRLSSLLQRELRMETLSNPDFFNHQIRERIARDEPDEELGNRGGVEGMSAWWPIRRLVWAGSAALAVFIAIAVFVMQGEPETEPSQYFSKIVEAKLDPSTTTPDATISIFDSKEDRVTVLWTEGLKSLPSEYAAK